MPSPLRVASSLACLLLLGAAGAAGQTAARPVLSEPGISPDGGTIAFVSGGDVWTVPAAGGEARLLVSHPAGQSRPLFSPDGQRLALVSDRTGNGDVYVLELETGALRRLTFDDARDQLDGWSADGRWIYFSSTGRDIAGMNDVFRVRVEGGTPMPVAGDRYVNEFFAAPAPDGGAVAVSARGIASGQWWRRGHSHIDQAELWLVHEGETPRYEPLGEGRGKELWPMWAPRGGELYFVSDRDGTDNVWARGADGTTRQVTRFTEGRVLWPSIARVSGTIAFERGNALWTLDASTGRAQEVPVRLVGAPAGRPGAERLRMTDGFSDLALAPDGKKLAFVARGEVFAASTEEPGDATRVTQTTAPESRPVWAPDSRRLVYASARDGADDLYLYDFGTGEERRLTRSPEPDHAPAFSPDGRQLAFLRGRDELRVLDVEGGGERLLARGAFGLPPIVGARPFAWSPDGAHIAYLSRGDRQFTNVHLVPLAGGEARPASWLANVFADAVTWSPDGTRLYWATRQRTEDGSVARVDLVPRTPLFREDRFLDLFRQEPSQSALSVAPGAAASPVVAAVSAATDIVWDGLRTRLELLPVGVDAGHVEISPDGKLLLMTAAVAGRTNLFTWSLDELATEPAVARQITSTPGGKAWPAFSPDGRTVWYLEGGRIHSVPADGGSPRPLAVTAELVVDFEAEKLAVFDQAWSWLNDHFYDGGFHGVDWAAVREAYAPWIAGARTPEELRRTLRLMVGELNASHLGVSAPPGGGGPSAGRLGLAFERVEYEESGRLRITDVVPLGPAAVAGRIRAGQWLRAVDGARLAPPVNLDSLLQNTIGRRVVLTVADSPEGGTAQDVAVQPVNMATEKALLYDAWVEANRLYVERESGGRLGYVHMPDMSWNSLLRLHRDLDAENHAREGVVVDVRNNNGGFVNVYAIDVFARRDYLVMTPRGEPAGPARGVLGQRALGLPTVLVTNRHSLSDAEDFAEGYRALGLGPVIGEPTAGWIIYTWNQPLLDRSVLRLPRMKVTDMAGENMELMPRPVDVHVVRPVGEGYDGRDSELDAAIRELLGRVANGG